MSIPTDWYSLKIHLWFWITKALYILDQFKYKVGLKKLHSTTEWLNEVLNDPSDVSQRATCKIVGSDRLHGGLVAQVERLKIHSKDASIPSSFVVKSVPNEHFSRFFNHAMHSYVEAKFYAASHKISSLTIPRFYHADVSLFSGECTLLLEDVQPSILVSKLLGNQCWGIVDKSNWPKDLPSGIQVTEMAFDDIASLHASFWGNDGLVMEDFPWMYNADFLLGRNASEYRFCKSGLKGRWSIVKKARFDTAREYQVKWDSKLVSYIESCMEISTWERFQRESKSQHWTLGHGDFHAGNLLWNTETQNVVFLDWPRVGIHNGPAEISQYIISNLTVQDRKDHEMDLLKRYWQKLIKLGVDERSYSFETCYEDYKRGAVDRWIQLLVIMASIGAENPQALSDPVIQWFHDQVASFVHDHIDMDVPLLLSTAYPSLLQFQ